MFFFPILAVACDCAVPTQIAACIDAEAMLVTWIHTLDISAQLSAFPVQLYLHWIVVFVRISAYAHQRCTRLHACTAPLVNMFVSFFSPWSEFATSSSVHRIDGDDWQVQLAHVLLHISDVH